MKFHPLYERRFAMGLQESRAHVAGHLRDPVHAQAARQLFAGLADPCPRSPYRGPAAAGRTSALQRRLHAARLDLAVLSAVRLARCRRADDEGPLRRSAVGRHGPAGHRVAQEAAAVRREFEEKEARPGAALVLRPLRARTASPSPTSPSPAAARGRLGEPADRHWRADSALLGASPARPGTASPMSSRASRSPTRTS